MRRAIQDRLMQMCEKCDDQIAERWYETLNTNRRTSSYSVMPKPVCLRHAVSVYKNLGKMYFAQDSYKTAQDLLDVDGFAEDNYARGIPLSEVLYALILMRRHIWLYAEFQALFDSAEDLYPLLKSINRLLLLFDYATNITACKYEKMSAAAKKAAK